MRRVLCLYRVETTLVRRVRSRGKGSSFEYQGSPRFWGGKTWVPSPRNGEPHCRVFCRTSDYPGTRNRGKHVDLASQAGGGVKVSPNPPGVKEQKPALASFLVPSRGGGWGEAGRRRLCKETRDDRGGFSGSVPQVSGWGGKDLSTPPLTPQ